MSNHEVNNSYLLLKKEIQIQLTKKNCSSPIVGDYLSNLCNISLDEFEVN